MPAINGSESYASQILAVHGKLVVQEQTLNATAKLLSTLEGTVKSLVSSVNQLGKAVAELQPTEDGDSALWDWVNMDQVQATKAWNTLYPWVHGVLGGWYDRVGANQQIKQNMDRGRGGDVRQRIPECWPAHMDVVIELSWLYQEWHRLYETADGTPARAGDWHARYLPGLLGRIRTQSTAAQCLNRHTSLEDKDPYTRPRDGVVEPFEAKQHILADIQRRKRPGEDAAAVPDDSVS